MTATYPTDVIFDVNTFSVIGSVTYTTTGSFTTDFALGADAKHKGEILAFNEGILQDTSIYALPNSNTVSFLSPPNASNLTLKTITVPSNLVKFQSEIGVASVFYNNTEPVSVNGNTYVTDGARTAWSLPSALRALGKNEIIIGISGVVQPDSFYTFPSVTLDEVGLDITDPIISPFDTIDIRLISGSLGLGNDRCKDLADRKPDRGFSAEEKIDVVTFESTAGYEKRRLRSRRAKRKWNLSYTNISGTEKSALEVFYRDRFGSFEAFFFDLTHVLELSGQATVRFEGPIRFTINAAKGTDLNDVFYTVKIVLQEVYD